MKEEVTFVQEGFGGWRRWDNYATWLWKNVFGNLPYILFRLFSPISVFFHFVSFPEISEGIFQDQSFCVSTGISSLLLLKKQKR